MNPGFGPEGTHITEGKSINKKGCPAGNQSQDEFAHLVNRVGVKRSNFSFFIGFIHIFPWRQVRHKKHWMSCEKKAHCMSLFLTACVASNTANRGFIHCNPKIAVTKQIRITLFLFTGFFQGKNSNLNFTCFLLSLGASQ